MAWLVLVVSGVLEAVWAVALGKTEGFTRLVPSAVFLVAIVGEHGWPGLRHADNPDRHRLRGVGGHRRRPDSGLHEWPSGEEPVSLVKVLLLLGLIGCVVGLKLAH